MARIESDERDLHDELIEYNQDRKSRRRDRRKKKKSKNKIHNSDDEFNDDDLDYEKFMGIR